MVTAGTARFRPEGQPGNSKIPSASRQTTPEGAARLAHLVSIPTDASKTGASPLDRQRFSRWCSEQLELGNILFIQGIPFEFPDDWRAFLLKLKTPESRHHKNIAYRPSEDRLTGFSSENKETQKQLHGVLRNYSTGVVEYLSNLLPEYARSWRLDYASFRPFEERGRDLRSNARNDLLHTDAFPTRPTNGDRILRFFTNINSEKPRVWLTGQTFGVLAEQYAVRAGLPGVPQETSALRALSRLGRRAVRSLRLPITPRSPYDKFMLRFHRFLKENREFQESCPKTRHEFPPGSCWVVFTDMVSHAVLSGAICAGADLPRFAQRSSVPGTSPASRSRAPLRPPPAGLGTILIVFRLAL